MILLATSQALFSAYFEADFFGKCIFMALFTVSIVCWIILVHKIMQVRKAKQLCYAFEKTFQKNKDQLLNLTVDQKGPVHPFSQVFQNVKQKTVEILNKNHFFAEDKEHVYLTRTDVELIESYVLTTISSEIKQLEKNLYILPTIVTLAPFMGLLGTVWGILVAFSGMQAGANVTSNTEILGGLSTALVTTVIGLLIAIPALISSSWLRNACRVLSSDTEDFLYKLLSAIELQYRKP